MRKNLYRFINIWLHHDEVVIKRQMVHADRVEHNVRRFVSSW